jgi:hypothetical protein
MLFQFVLQTTITPKGVFIPDNPSGREPIAGASLLAKNFASKLAPTIGEASNGQSGLKRHEAETVFVPPLPAAESIALMVACVAKCRRQNGRSAWLRAFRVSPD